MKYRVIKAPSEIAVTSPFGFCRVYYRIDWRGGGAFAVEGKLCYIPVDGGCKAARTRPRR